MTDAPKIDHDNYLSIAQMQALSSYAVRNDTDVLSGLFASMKALHARFGVTPTPKNQRRLVQEEFLEAMQASREHPITSNTLVEEIADCFVVLLGLAVAHGNSLPDVVDAMRAVIAKNDAKTDATHQVDELTGKIRRRKAG